ncbi:biotin carboxyl carrier protein [Hydrogenispora ethanolica]|uniref:Biotin carboxyl carrier protein of acetyl-CoA carboxylase n=1 Tax=Hydrogenispora ethanolica TaxID=1082276 RepID=A0A4R1RVX1_HYDET|nr:acetyl-CoA carboxylase biotin carboxyl carrier protein [Hydrogenispora ethanolica]TCL70808.1 biotin carboxyl carrier protein [Hydrogenispora ethanolica]
MNIKEIKELVKMLDGTDISEFCFESEGSKVVIKKGTAISPQGITSAIPMMTNPMLNAINIPAPAAAPAAAASGEEKNEGLGPNQVLITAPMVGTFYRSSSPDADPYVQPGQVVNVGEVVCIIEAMKLMNEIESEWRGKIVEVLVDNAQPVEYGQPLFVLEKL